MSRPIISVENLSKSYQLGVINTGTFHDDLERWWARVRGLPDPFVKIGEKHKGSHQGETLWALKDVNFTVQQGEAVGIIGRNGAGKSTLLKVLSRVTAQTSGAVKIKGRIASLLEVGTGFHPELTGRENIYLNGAILGMTQTEVSSKFDEIVDFSGVEKFIDTPVKRYSSGMYVRLAFAVAAHLEPEILVVDEVLAVGDAEFQKKCLGKMDDVAHQQGRTILFVSHNMGMINSLCNRAIYLDTGSVQWDGGVAEAIRLYYSNGKSMPFAIDYSQLPITPGDEYATLLEGRVENKEGRASGDIDIGETFYIKIKYHLKRDVPISPFAAAHVYNSQGQPVFITYSERQLPVNKAGVYEATCTIPGHLLNNDTYSIGLALAFTHSGIHVSFFEKNTLTVTIREDIDTRGNGVSSEIPGAVRPKLDWAVKRLS